MRGSLLKLRGLVSQFLLACAAIATISVVAEHTRPVYLGQSTVVHRLTEPAWRDEVALRAPWATDVDTAIASPRFAADRDAFAADLMRTGQVDEARAKELANVAVREAYQRRIPPALVFGVMMTENSRLRSSARSSVGAVGLMQIYPKAWVSSLGKLFGTNLRDDETNLQYGVFILSHLVYGSPDWMDADSTLRRALLRYNGCVRGTNTPNCARYPDVVRERIDQLAVAQCGDKGYQACVEAPLKLSMDDRTMYW
jgi:soluble lytic murein transglycosylase-like protein